MKIETYVVTVKRPNDVSVVEMRGYIKTAICQWSKGGDPDNSLWWVVCTQVKRLPTADSIRKMFKKLSNKKG
jgi:hypothetical protein